MEYDVGDYHSNYILERLKTEELNANSSLVETLGDGTRRVTKKRLIEKYGTGKSGILDVTLKYPELLNEYRNDRKESPRGPLSHAAISEASKSPPVDWGALYKEVRLVGKGNSHATAYHRAVESLLTTLLYPSLVNPRLENELHEGRKRIDITYDNAADSGFFAWLGKHYPAATIVVECKNYSSDPSNPELDQIAGRFSKQRGQVGLLVCRDFTDKKLFLKRCRDTAKEDRGFVIPLDDSDLHSLVESRTSADIALDLPLLRERFGWLIK